MRNNKTLYLFTGSFPLTTHESFLERELPYLLDSFQSIIIFPSCGEGKSCYDLPDHVRIAKINVPSKKQKLKLIFKYAGLFCSILKAELFHSRQRTLARENVKLIIDYLVIAFYRADELKKIISANTTIPVLYNFWFSDWAMPPAILKKWGIIPNFISRAHGFDLYEFTGKTNYLMFRKFLLSQVTKVLAVSNVGCMYLKDRYPEYSEKLDVSYLGTEDFGTGPFLQGNETVIVTCSSVVSVKRLMLLVQTFHLVKTDVKWIHFGDGPLFKELKEATELLPPNIRSHFMGRVTNQELMDFYMHNSVDVFVNVSISEGLPVSIMEAISFGIPVIATDVGGTKEIVTEVTGKLIPESFAIADLANELDRLKTSAFINHKYREGVRAFWLANFAAKKNYTDFIKKYLLGSAKKNVSIPLKEGQEAPKIRN